MLMTHDDLAVYFQFSNMTIIERCLQGCLDKFVDSCEQKRLLMFSHKTLCVHFCNKNVLQPEPRFKLYGQQASCGSELKIAQEVEFYSTYIKYIKYRYRNSLQLLRLISNPARIGVVTRKTY